MDDEEFVKAFIYAFKHQKGLEYVAKKMHRKNKAVSDKAVVLRRLGVKLPYMVPAKDETRVRVDKLNSIITRELLNG
jgi:hypothetical protein